MKLLLLHGPASQISRQKLINLKTKFKLDNIVVFENVSDPQVILGHLMTQSLLGEEQLFILENPPEDFTNYTLNPNPSTLIFWFDHELSEKKGVFEFVKKAKGEVLFFPESKERSIFPFLDLLATGDNKAFLEIKKINFDIHYIITMVYYLLRNLLLIPKNAPPFVRQKLERQRKRYTFKKLTNLFKEVLEIDFKLKSGLLERPQAEFLLINKFLTA